MSWELRSCARIIISSFFGACFQYCGGCWKHVFCFQKLLIIFWGHSVFFSILRWLSNLRRSRDSEREMHVICGRCDQQEVARTLVNCERLFASRFSNVTLIWMEGRLIRKPSALIDCFGMHLLVIVPNAVIQWLLFLIFDADQLYDYNLIFMGAKAFVRGGRMLRIHNLECCLRWVRLTSCRCVIVIIKKKGCVGGRLIFEDFWMFIEWWF